MSDSEDDFVTYGSALEPLDEENLPRKKPVTIEDQYALDAQGRRRFHGAFTGGFSAGYFNSVGTQDGWRPQQFKSTRSSKSGNVVQKPEDFMDEEDTGEFGIAPTAIRATQEYSEQSSKGTKRERAKHDATGPIPGTPVLHQILKPVRERVGVMLLKKMGWKPGQGVGPRLTKQEKKQKKQQQQNAKVYGCSLPSQQEKVSGSESDDSDDDYTSNITFAPDDYEPYRCDPKDNYFGIGYSGLDRHSVLGGHINLFDPPTFSIQEKNKKFSIRGQAFGVGAFEAEDEDIYNREDMSRYDFSLGPERKSKSRWSKDEKPKPDCIEGFVPSKEQFPQKKVFPAPVLPKDFQPVHKVKKSRFSPLPGEKTVVQKRPEMNAESRAKIINDERPSIIDSKTMEVKNTSVAAKLITRALNLHGKEQTAERQKLEESRPTKTPMSWLDKLSATKFVKGEVLGNDPKVQGTLQSASSFAQETDDGMTRATKPKFGDLDKQRRFEQYLNFSEGERKLKFPTVQPLSMTEWERDQEIAEFESAAKLCERIDGATKSEEEKKEKEAEAKIDLESLGTEERMMAAAKMKMFGKLTRSESEWRPAKLVCVRFNVAEPLVGVAVEEKGKKKFSIFDSLRWDEMSRFEQAKKLEHEIEPRPSTSSGYTSANDERNYRRDRVIEEPPSKVNSKPVSEKEKAFEASYEKVFGKGVDTQKREEDEEATKAVPEKPEEAPAPSNIQEKKDLFKSIFLSSSDESESETEGSKDIDVDDENVKAAVIGKSAAEKNTQRNTSPPRGIFANVDLDSLMKRPVKKDSLEDNPKQDEAVSKDKTDEVKIEKPNADEQMEEDGIPPDMYGPILPQALPPVNEPTKHKHLFSGSSKKSSDTDDGVWVEKPRDKKKSKKEKKKHKHKERSRSKSRKKSKKEKKH